LRKFAVAKRIAGADDLKANTPNTMGNGGRIASQKIAQTDWMP
jgi:hypothetical protein